MISSYARRQQVQTMVDLSSDVGPNARVIQHASGAQESDCPFAPDQAPRAFALIVEGLARARRFATDSSDGDRHQPHRLGDPGSMREGALTGDRWMALTMVLWAMHDASEERLVAGACELVEHVSGCHGLPARTAATLLEVARILRVGEKRYGRDNWRKIPVAQHLRHASSHLLADISGDRSEGEYGHLLRAICRIMLAIEVSSADNDATRDSRRDVATR